MVDLGVTRRRRVHLPACPICARSLDAHSLPELRACGAELAKREPSYCRLTGPRRPVKS
jgi:hypothetical protein